MYTLGKPIHDGYVNQMLFCDANPHSIDNYVACPHLHDSFRNEGYGTASPLSTVSFKLFPMSGVSSISSAYATIQMFTNRSTVGGGEEGMDIHLVLILL